MLKLQQAPTFEAKVEIPLPGDQVAVVKCTFRWMHRNDLRIFLGQVVAAGRMASLHVRLAQWGLRGAARVPGARSWASKRVIKFRTDFDILNSVLVSWDGVDMAWGPKACKQLLAMHPNAVSLILAAWVKGLNERRLGN